MPSFFLYSLEKGALQGCLWRYYPPNWQLLAFIHCQLRYHVWMNDSLKTPPDAQTRKHTHTYAQLLANHNHDKDHRNSAHMVCGCAKMNGFGFITHS